MSSTQWEVIFVCCVTQWDPSANVKGWFLMSFISYSLFCTCLMSPYCPIRYLWHSADMFACTSVYVFVLVWHWNVSQPSPQRLLSHLCHTCVYKCVRSGVDLYICVFICLCVHACTVKLVALPSDFVYWDCREACTSTKYANLCA